MKKKYKKGIEASAGLMREDEEEFAAAYHKQFEDFFAFIEQNNVRVKDAVEMHLADLPFEQIWSGEKTGRYGCMMKSAVRSTRETSLCFTARIGRNGSVRG